jgi:hypothetical protein
MKTKTRAKNKSGNAGAAKKKQAKKIIIASIAVGAAGILGYFGWQYLKKKRKPKNGGDLDEILKTSGISKGSSGSNDTPAYTPPKTTNTSKQTGSSTSYSIPKSVAAGSVFPLKKGSKGEDVRLLQQALIAKYGKTILPKYGADGDFGSEMVSALKKVGLPATINESTFKVLIQAEKRGNSNLGIDLYNAAITKNYTKVVSLLKQMQTADDYSSANEVFKENRINGVRQTIVNGLLNSFTSTEQKEAIKFEFLRMGLQFDGNKWSLSGFDGKPVVTTEPTTVWVNATEGLNVPARMVLGNEVSRRLDYTLFENNGKYFLVNTKSVQYLN